MKKGLTEVVFILDRSGSMMGMERDTIGGFNSMIDKQKKEEGDALISTVLFDHETLVLHDRVPIGKIGNMTQEEYFVRGSTALLDAVGGAIHHIANVHRYAREEDRPERTIFVITTDGMENASRYYSYEKVKKMVELEKEKYGWEFLFLGANIDAAREAGRFGICANRAVNFHNDSVGTAINYETVSNAIGDFRRKAAVREDWAAPIQADYAARKTDWDNNRDDSKKTRSLFHRFRKPS